jgi:Raf kinase inhibitor-like YbhB/YbcL family protein
VKLWSDSFGDGAPIPPEFAFGRADPRLRVTLAPNRNPHLAWSGAPAGTRSFAILCIDPDVPSLPDDVNHPDREVPEALPRTEFFHWVLVDLPAELAEIGAGEFSDGVTPKGKSGPETLHDARQGLNDYTNWFAGDPDMAGEYYGYDGPCPPWNDTIVHRYRFVVLALDIALLPTDRRFNGTQARAAMQGHVLAEASITGTYTLNPRLAPPAPAPS